MEPTPIEIEPTASDPDVGFGVFTGIAVLAQVLIALDAHGRRLARLEGLEAGEAQRAAERAAFQGLSLIHI